MSTKQCVQCNKTFQIDDHDLAFYKKMQVPQPTHCPDCRLQRRLAFRNERNLYQRTCDLTGKPILSAFSLDKPFPVYSIEAWWLDKWNALDYGREYDFNKAFFEQYRELQAKVPRLALQQQQPMENSEYCNCASRNKNCYLVFSTNQCEDCYHGSWVNSSKNCVDSYDILNCELCYENIDCLHCYNCSYAQDNRDCTDCYFIKNCVGSNNLAFCTNLVNASYQIFNKPVSPEQFAVWVKALRAATSETWRQYQQDYLNLIKKSFVRFYQGARNEASTGNYIYNCHQCADCFLVTSAEQLRYCAHLEFVKDAMDYTYWGQQAELMYEVIGSGYQVNNLKFCVLCWSGCKNLEYCDHCFSCQDCFGCVGLKKQQYCILNKQFTKSAYEIMVNKIKAQMRKNKEYGEFFPVSCSPFAYNESLANDFFPLSEAQVARHGWQWKMKNSSDYQTQQYKIPPHILNVPDNIVKELLACELCGKNYKIVLPELQFYRTQLLPIPTLCPECRHLARVHRRPGYAIWSRRCMCTQPMHKHSGRCDLEVSTAYSPDKPELIYCEECYQKEIY
ncbi:MAG: hypothetical protein WCW27_03125 [Patescibacteria group bacterium]|jgi:hypothetical protein